MFSRIERRLSLHLYISRSKQKISNKYFYFDHLCEWTKNPNKKLKENLIYVFDRISYSIIFRFNLVSFMSQLKSVECTYICSLCDPDYMYDDDDEKPGRGLQQRRIYIALTREIHFRQSFFGEFVTEFHFFFWAKEE